MTDYVCVPRDGNPGFGGGVGRDCRLEDASVVYHDKYSARTLLRGSGEEDVDAYFYKEKGSPVGPITAGTKSDSKFGNFATDFEKAFSVLLKQKKGRFYVSAYTHFYANPVLDKDYMVVGHYGWFKGNHIYVGNASPRRRGSGELAIEFSLAELLEDDATVFIGQRDNDCYAWATDDEKYLLLTDVDGRVLRVDGYDLIGIESADDTLLVVGLLFGAAHIAAQGVKAGIRSLARSAARSRTKRALRGIISGNPPGVGTGHFGQPGSLFGHVQVVDNEVQYVVKAIVLKGGKTAEEMTAIRVARMAHREMIMQSAETARKNGHKVFRIRGVDANAEFRVHADRLAREVGVPGSAQVLKGSAPGFTNYEVTLDAAKVLAQR